MGSAFGCKGRDVDGDRVELEGRDEAPWFAVDALRVEHDSRAAYACGDVHESCQSARRSGDTRASEDTSSAAHGGSDECVYEYAADEHREVGRGEMSSHPCAYGYGGECRKHPQDGPTQLDVS